MLKVTDLKKSYGDRVLFDEVEFAVGKNEKVGLIGRNGTGKSTLLKVILGEEKYDEGKIHMPSSYIVKALEQNLNFEESSALRQVEKSLSRMEKGHVWKVHTILDGLGFSPEQKEMDPLELSSGYKVRLRLAEVLVSQADLLILDEPTNYLDILSLRWLEDFLKTWSGAFVLVTHDRTFMEKVVTHTMVIRRGKLKKVEGGPVKLLEQVRKDEEIYEKTRQNMVKKREKTEEFIRKFRAGARSAGLVQSRIKSLEKQDLGEKMRKIADVKFQFKGEVPEGNYIFRMDDLGFGYDPKGLLFEGLDMEVKIKDRIGIIGKNGAGKSTLMDLLAGYNKALKGELEISEGVKVGYFGSKSFQDLNENNTILKELHDLPGVVEKQVRQVCGALLFRGDDVHKKIKVLSGGEKSRVCLAKVMLTGCNLLMLDEPTNHLDMESCVELSRSLREFDGAVFVVTHDESMLMELANRLVVFGDAFESGARVMNFGYKEFLKRGGWENYVDVESDEGSDSDELDESKLSKKELFELEKARKKDQRRIMMEIDKLEKRKGRLEDELAKACADQDVEEIERLGVKVAEMSGEIDGKFEELEGVM
jgi:ATP-binding cassette subfamily F protein 3